VRTKYDSSVETFPSGRYNLGGTDFPFRDGAEINAGIAAYGFNPDDVRAIEREVAIKLIPRLRQA